MERSSLKSEDQLLQYIDDCMKGNVEEVPSPAELSKCVVNTYEPLNAKTFKRLNAKTCKERCLLPWACLHFSALCL